MIQWRERFLKFMINIPITYLVLLQWPFLNLTKKGVKASVIKLRSNILSDSINAAE